MPRPPDRLDALRVVTPCSVPWSSMEGDDQIRFCGQCRKNVYNVAAIPRQEVLALIDRAEGRVCMQLARRPDGTITTGDCWARLRWARRQGLLAFAAAVPVVLLAELWAQAFGLRALTGFFHRVPPPPPPIAVPAGGAIAAPQPLPPAPIPIPVRGKVAFPLPLPTEDRMVKGEIALPQPARPPKRKRARVDPEEMHALGGAVVLDR